MMRHNVSVVTYHDISTEPSPLTAQLFLSTRPEIFRDHVTYFAKNFDIIGADELLDNRLPRRALLLTFDDAYRSVLTIAGPILKEVSAPSIFFVIPSVVQGDTLPIDNVLSLAIEQMGLSRVLALMKLTVTSTVTVGDIISQFIAQMGRDDVAKLKARIFCALGTTEMGERRSSGKFLDAADVGELAKYRIEVGNHSMTHSHFRGLSRRELDIEIAQSRRELQRLSGQPVHCLSIPFGDQRDTTDEAMAVARESGHQAIFLVHGRSNYFRPHKDTYYRVSLRNEETWMVRLGIRVFPIIRSGLAPLRRTFDRVN